ncbi:MAG: fibrobacter succinogenes major paralogous domain-containing protein, partial [Gammaproteobacteria bacterium]|nr:fibrobacter succinogenes major paralogous domain-containing protein [Gammaproteobacteria bacterium]
YGEGTSVVHSGSDDEVTNLANYGRLYNWYAVDDARGLCPSGWHVPTDGEFTTLEMELGMSESEANDTGWRGTDHGSQMKSSPGDNPSWNGTNTSGFSGLAGGYRRYNGDFYYVGNNGYFWSASASGTYAWSRGLDGGLAEVVRDNDFLRSGFSVRCVRD